MLLALVGIGVAGEAVHAAELFGDPSFESVGNADQIPDLNVSQVVEGKDGYLWVGTPNGVLRYDGYRFRRITLGSGNQPSVGGVYVNRLLATSDGRLWIATDADGLFVLDPHGDTARQLRHSAADADSLGHDSVTSLAEDRDGRLWVGTRQALERLDPKTGRFTHYTVSPNDANRGKHGDVQQLLIDRSGYLWIGAWAGLYRRRAADGLIAPVFGAAAAADPMTGAPVNSLYELADGRIAVGTAHASGYVVDPGTLAMTPFRIPPTGDWAAKDSTILCLLQPRPDEIWLSGWGGLLVVGTDDLAPRRYLRHDPAIATSMAHAEIRTMAQDRSGILWVGGYGGGLQRIDPNNDSIRVMHHSPARPTSLTSVSISAELELDSGELWIGTRQDGIDIFDRRIGVTGGIRAASAGRPGLRSGLVTGLAQTTDRSVWVATMTGLDRVDPDTHVVRAVDGAALLDRVQVRRLLRGQADDLWIGSNSGLAHWRPETDRIEFVANDRRDVSWNEINALAQEADGRLWIGSGVDGLSTLVPATGELRHVEIVGADPTRIGKSVQGLLLDRDGALWVDTPEGLFRSRGPHDATMRFDDLTAVLRRGGRAFGANLLQDDQGRIWTPRYVLDPGSDLAHVLTRADGVDFGTPWFRSYTRTRDGLFLFGGSQGLLVVDPSRFKPWSYAAPLQLSELRLNGERKALEDPAAGLALGTGVRSLALEFVALDFSAPERITYRYRLDGYDEDWTGVDGDHRVASYGRLAPGDYVFRVRAENRNGTASANELAIPIRVDATWWQTLWFKILLVVAFLLLVQAGYRLYAAGIRRRAQELERLVTVRTAELGTAKEHAEAALDALRNTQQQLVESEKMAALGGLVAGVAHEINTPLGISVTAITHLGAELRLLDKSALAQGAQGAELRQFSTMAHECTELIERNLERVDRLVKSFKQVAADQSSDQMREIDLGAYLQEILLSLQPLLKRTAHRIEIACPEDIRMTTYPGAIYEVVTNLVVNSLTHAFDGGQAGTLSIAVSRVCDASRTRPDAVHIEYRDNGRGMSAEVLAHVFDPFFTTRRGQGGTGLGMHIAFNRVTQVLQGTIHCDSRPGAGVLFTIELPLVVKSA